MGRMARGAALVVDWCPRCSRTIGGGMQSALNRFLQVAGAPKVHSFEDLGEIGGGQNHLIAARPLRRRLPSF